MAVQEGAVHSYKEGTKLQDPFDGLQLDHIPSKQAIKEAYVIIDFIISKEKECQIKN